MEQPTPEQIVGVPPAAASMSYKDGRYVYTSTFADSYKAPSKNSESLFVKEKTEEHLVFDKQTNKWKIASTTTTTY
jgi:hypothetical protein